MHGRFASLMILAVLVFLIGPVDSPAAAADLEGPLVIVSVPENGEMAIGDSAYPQWSPSGDAIAFDSWASNLIPNDTNGTCDVFIKDLSSGEVTRVSELSDGTEGNFYSFLPQWSPDGTKIAFHSLSTSFVPDTNSQFDVFVKDLATGVVSRISTTEEGEQANGYSENAAWSPDGTKIAFYSSASNLVEGDTNSRPDVFVKDLATGAVTLVSAVGSEIGNAGSGGPRWSPDGTRIVFVSEASNLVPGDTNDAKDIFVKDLTSGAIERITISSDGIQAEFGSDPANVGEPVWSPDGKRIAFYSFANNLVPNDTNHEADVFVKDLVSGVVERVSTTSNGAEATGSTLWPAWGPDEDRIAFVSEATDLVPNDTNGDRDIFVKDLATGEVTRVSTSSTGEQGNRGSRFLVWAPDGVHFVFETDATNLGAGYQDLFIRLLDSDLDGDGDGNDNCPYVANTGQADADGDGMGDVCDDNPSGRGTFSDDDHSIFEPDIERIAAAGITRGCNPPENNLFCPKAAVTRGQMAAFLVRALDLPPGEPGAFIDDDESIFQADIEALASAGITRGCNPPTGDRFCPEANVTRQQMAAFLVRALGLTTNTSTGFIDDDDSVFEDDIEKLATAGITQGCNPPINDMFCPKAAVTRGQMAAFLSRALGL
jgi:Tol biopolymer transport system component